ncbi:unnamed protein product, partial [Mesorhabditis belari]|uniref:Uncharacterized protein n=1 Tax=Mesorhabditis belari TaxID=2138241 RepID=A0AAF3FD26_9BILA
MKWLWRPELNPERPVREENYRCFCAFLTAKVGCALFILLDIFIIGVWSTLLYFLPQYFYFWAIGIANSIFFITLALFALYKQTPVLIQVYWILFLFELIVFSILFTVLNLVANGAVIR